MNALATRSTPAPIIINDLLRPDVGFNTIRTAIEHLLHSHEQSQWLIGDLWNHCDTLFHTTYTDALHELKRTHGTLEDYGRVARAFPAEPQSQPLTSEPARIAHRRNDVPFTHHRILATIPDEHERIAWLDDCVRQNWSKRELEDQLRHHYGRARTPALSLPRATGERFDLYTRAAQHAGFPDPTTWALEALDRAARLELEAKTR